MKEYTVKVNRFSYSGVASERIYTGTMEHLVNDVFSYTLECGHSWEYERGNRKVNMNPRTGRTLVNALNNAAYNTSRNGNPNTYYTLVENA